MVLAAQQQQQQKSDYSDDDDGGSGSGGSGMEKREEIVNAFRSFSDERKYYQQSCGLGGSTTTVCDSNALAMYSSSGSSSSSSSSTVFVYRQSIPELLKLTLELYYELLNILHEQQMASSADLPLLQLHGIISIGEVLDRMRLLLELLVDLVHESQLRLVEDMTMDFLLTAG